MQSLVISNLFGFGFVAVSWVAAILIYETWESHQSWSLPWLLASLLLILLDVGYRLPGHPLAATAPGGSSGWSFIALGEPLLTPTRGASL
jgi:hypothetical protein